MIERSNITVLDGSVFDAAAYEVVIRPLDAAEGGGWLATIPALPGCTGDGETEIEAIEDVRLAALEWALAAVRDGDPVPTPDNRKSVAAE